MEIKDTAVKYDGDQTGITFRMKNEEVKVSFSDCIKNFANEYNAKSRTGVGTTDITKHTIILYTVPHTRIIFTKGLLPYLLTGKTANERFLQFQNMINRLGYTTYDLS